MRVALALVLLLGACGAPCQKANTTRCNGSLVELCGSNGRWQRGVDCSQLKAIRPGAPAVWKCSETPKGCTCVPVGGDR